MSSSETATPRVIDGKFQILSELGRGRLGRLFAARLLTSEKTVAVRLLDAELLADRKRTRQLMSDIVAARGLRHRDIGAILGFHMGGERPYLVLEHVQGRTLDETLAQRPGGRCGMVEFDRLASSVTRVLEFAHTRGVSHGNLHPNNILIRPDDGVSLLDFGVGCPGSGRFPQTQAPELASGETTATPQSDIFAVGAVFYRMLGGVWPQRHSAYKPLVGVGSALDQAIQACLNADPDHRPTAAQLTQVLEGQSATPAAQASEAAVYAAVRSDEPARGLESKLLHHLPFSIAASMLLILSLAVVIKTDSPGMSETVSAAPRTEVADAPDDPPAPVAVESVRAKAGQVWTSPRLSSEFVYIPAGSATLGSRDGDADERPHEVKISNGFWMGRHEVTQREWESVMGTRPWQGKMESRPDLPATWVSWDQVNEFVHRLNRSAAGESYRLPSEAEWEYAALGTSAADPLDDPTGELSRTAWFKDNSNGGLHPVGLKESTRWGLNDIQGNAWEWVHDWYADYPSVSQIDPQGPTSGQERVVRGCSFFNPASICRVANRHKVDPRSSDRHIGFRLVRDGN